MSSDFHFLVPESFPENLVQIGTVVSEKIQFEFLYEHDLGTRSRNDLDLQYSYIFIYLIRCLLILPFSSPAAIVSEKSTLFTDYMYTPILTIHPISGPINNTRGPMVL